MEMSTALHISVRPVSVELLFTNSRRSGIEGARRKADTASRAQRKTPTGIAKVSLVRRSLNKGIIPSSTRKMIRPLKERERTRRPSEAEKPIQRIARRSPGFANKKMRPDKTIALARAFFCEKTPCQSPE